MARQKDYYYVFFHESVKCCAELQDFCWTDIDNKLNFKTKNEIKDNKYFALRFAVYYYGDARVLVKSKLPYAKLKKIINTKKEYWVHHHYEKHLEVVDTFFNTWAGKDSGACHHQACLDGDNFYDYDIGTNPKIDEQFEKDVFDTWDTQIIFEKDFSFADITKHYVVDQRAKRFELEEDFYDELSEAYINKPTKKLTKYRIDFEGKRVCEYYSESIGNGTALDYWDEVTGYQEIEYYGSDEDLKNDLEIYAEEEEDEYCGVKFNNHLWLSQILSYIADEVGDSDWYSNDKETIINTGFDYKGKDDNDIVAEYLERADGDFSETETIGLYVKSLRVTTIS